jgi:ABC-type uncharacterized transport system substrate-binding protein
MAVAPCCAIVRRLAAPAQFKNNSGLNILNLELTAKRLELLREMVPAAARIAVLVNPANPTSTQTTLREVETAGRAMGLSIQIFNAGTSREICCQAAREVHKQTDKQGRAIIDRYLAKNCDKEKDRRP